MPIYSYRAVLTAAQCICDFADEKPESVTFCKPNARNGRQPADQIISYPIGGPGSIQELYKRGAEVDTKIFNEITLKVGDKNTNNAFQFNAANAYVRDAFERRDMKGEVKIEMLRGFDIGIVLSVSKMVSTVTCKCVGTIALPDRYRILLGLHFYCLLIASGIL